MYPIKYKYHFKYIGGNPSARTPILSIDTHVLSPDILYFSSAIFINLNFDFIVYRK